ncbi:erythrocyte band 7 integral membrane protein [Ceratitis capitata]|uniref:Stomatin-4 n=1 Tax=Ceratitis capitata TaxID=7213 RepID=W8C7M1_CERCA|nr:erythrocyte band 7 integral membrane protein [Ceratitis capitata]
MPLAIDTYSPTENPVVTSENRENSLIETVAFVSSFIMFLVFFPISIFSCLVVMLEFQRAVVFRLGRLRKGGPRGPGILFILPCIDSIVTVDLRTIAFDVPPQEVLTRDSVTVTLDAVIYYRIHDPLKAVIQVENVMSSTMLLAQTTLRNVAGTKMLMELLADKEAISKAIEAILDEATDPWGVKVELVEIKDVRLPQSLQRAMAAEAEATREAKAKIVAAEGEFNASKALKQASDIIAKNPIALQLRYLQTMNTISAERNTTIIFPFPIELMDI